MSAYLVSRGHIRYLVEAALCLRDRPAAFYYYQADKHHEVNDVTADATGLMLWSECAKSVACRYPSDDIDSRPGPIGDGPEYGYTHQPTIKRHAFDPVQVLKAILCYEYQSCEHPEWKASAARAFCHALTYRAIGSLPRFHDAIWGCPESFEIERPSLSTPNVVRMPS